MPWSLVTDSGLVTLSQQCAGLRALDIFGCRGSVTDMGLRALATGRCSGQLEVRRRDVRAHCHRSGTAGPGNWTLFWPAGGKGRDAGAHCQGAGTAGPAKLSHCSGQLEVGGGMSRPTVMGLELWALAIFRCSSLLEVRKKECQG